MKAAKALIECLQKEKVDVVFGYPGGSVLPLYDELYDSDLRHILVRHESGAAFAADGYARATGKVGVCIATSGPGATNLVTGIASAYMDSIPIIAITGQVIKNMIGNDAFQEADITGITLPITKHNYLVKDARTLPTCVKEAFHIASTGRPGPVLIDIPRDVFQEEIECNYPEKIGLLGYKPTLKGHPGQIKKAAEVIANAERPVIIAGGGIISANASEELYELATMTGTPVATTLVGKGAFPETHPLSLGMLGMHGTKYANFAIMNADLLIAIGMRFDDRVVGKIETFAPKAKIIHIDVDPAEIGKSVLAHIPIVGDVKNVLMELLPRLKKIERTEWNKRIETLKKENPLSYKMTRAIKPQYVVEQIYEACPDAIIVTEVGQNQMWAAQFFKCTKPRTFISSGGLGAMGYGLPAAIGAKVGCPEKTVIDIAGDGSLMMSCQQLATAVDEEIPIKVMVLNNGYLGMVRQWQEIFYNKRYSYTLMKTKTDFVKLAEAMGAVGIRVTEKDDVRDAIEEALKIDRPVLIDFHVVKEENVSPMVPPGGSIDQMMDLAG